MVVVVVDCVINDAIVLVVFTAVDLIGSGGGVVVSCWQIQRLVVVAAFADSRCNSRWRLLDAGAAAGAAAAAIVVVQTF